MKRGCGLQLNQSIAQLRIFLSRHRNMLVIESFLRSLVKVYGKHTAVYSDCGGT
jgi:transposase-like protein